MSDAVSDAANERWYTALILSRAEVEGEDPDGDDVLHDWTWRLIRAEFEGDAREAAERYARAAEVTYANEDGKAVSWKFVDVMEVQEVNDEDLVSGTEVFSRLVLGPMPEFLD